ncbi:MAG TPA: penicillin-binding protein 2 [Gaiellales bacterium]
MFLPSSPEPREQRPQTPQLALRVAVLGTIGLFVFSVLVFRLWALQVLASDTYRARATAQQVKQVSIPAARGDIVDLNGIPLVTNRPSLELQLDPSLVSSSMARHRIILRLAKLLNADPRAIWEDVDRQVRLDPLAPVTVARDVDRSIVFYLGEHEALYPGVTVVEGEKRTYPNGRLAAHVFGQLSEINAKELTEPAYQGYKAGWVIGQNGVEGTYDRWLRGEDGIKRVTIDATGTPLSDQVVRAARSGYQLRLTISKPVQEAAQAALAAGVRRAAPNGADSGALIAMDVKTGAILAMASYPSFDPNWFVSPDLKKNRSHLRYLETAKTTPQLNRAIAGLYPAASTFKPFTAIAAVQSGVLPNIYDLIQCGPQITIAGHTFHNWDPYADSAMTLPTALAQSCDTYFYELGKRIYDEDKQQGSPEQYWAGQFGFGKTTGIDIAGESPGVVPTKAYREKTYHTLVDQQWRPGDSVLLAIGQGDLLVTPLQIAVGYAAIANGGYIVTPHVGQQIEDDSNGTHVIRNLASNFPRHKITLEPGLLQAIRTGLEAGTHDPQGTSSPVFSNFQIDVAGKTGTAEKTGEPNTAVFASYAPANDPKIAVVVLISKGGHGGSAAAPTALDFYSRYFGTTRPSESLLNSFTDNSR